MDVHPRVNFFILGAAKCGTTMLHTLLRQHPDICMSSPKEPAFFEAEYERGVDYYWRTYFERSWAGESIVGESRHRNLYLPYIPPRIKLVAPDAKLIVLVRNPVERAWSHWWHRHARGQDRLSFDDALEADLSRIARGINFELPDGPALWGKNLDPTSRDRTNEYRTYIDSGYYASQIARYLEHFPPDQLLVLSLKALSLDTHNVTGRILDFLGVEFVELEVDEAERNAAAVGYPRPLRAGLDRARHSRLSRKLERRIRGRALAGLPSAPRPTMSSTTRSELARHFDAHNKALEHLVTDLDDWLDM